MKINPTNGTNLNPYVKNINKQENIKKSNSGSDKLEISNQAKQLQSGNSMEKARQEKVNTIKQQVQNGEYDVNPKKTAEKMIDFWSNRRI